MKRKKSNTVNLVFQSKKISKEVFITERAHDLTRLATNRDLEKEISSIVQALPRARSGVAQARMANRRSTSTSRTLNDRFRVPRLQSQTFCCDVTRQRSPILFRTAVCLCRMVEWRRDRLLIS